MTLLKDELMKATKMDEATLRQKLISKAPNGYERVNADRAIEGNAVKANSWAYITMLYAPSDSTLKDRMLKTLK